MKKIYRQITAVFVCLMMTGLIVLSPMQALAVNEEPDSPGIQATAPENEDTGEETEEDKKEDTEPPEETEAEGSIGAGSEAEPAPDGEEDTRQKTQGVTVDALYTVRFYDWDNTLLSTQSVPGGEAAAAPDVPDREGYRFTGWSADFNNISSDIDIVAQYVELDSYTITINYIFANSTIALQPVVFSVAEGASFNRTVDSPAIPGYEPDQASVVIDLEDVRQDHPYTVIYTPAGDTPYKIEYYLQDLTLTNPGTPADPKNFTLEEEIDLTGQTGAQVTATAKDYPGFSPPATMPTAQIAADGGTVLRVYYTRNQYAVYFDTAGGSYVAPFAVLYGDTVTPPASPTRAGYSFTGWSPALPATMPANDVTVTATWQTAGQVEYTLVYWLENITSTGYDYVGTAMSSGAAGASPVIPTAVPSGVTFPIASTRYARNTTKTNAEKPAAIEGAGTTIVNVYYDRNSYPVSFTFNANKYTLTVNGTTYSNGVYQFSAKYGAPIDALWPGTPTLRSGAASDGNFLGWTGGSTNYITRQYTMNDSIINATPFSASWSTSTRNVTVNYYFQNVSGSGYSLGDTQTVAAQSNSTTWNSKTFVGFTAQQASLPIPSSGPVNFYYTRNMYNITYYNGGVIDRNTTGVYYQTALGGYGYTPNRPASIPTDYVFGGWYTTPQGYEGSEFAFAGATMPAYSLILYAHWVKPQYTVTFVPDNGDANFTQQVYALENATAPAAPTKPGYVFGGWYLPGASLHYVFSFPVSGNITLTARWIAQNNITYDVVYIKDGAEYQRFSYGGKTMGDSVTANAITIPGYLPDALSKSLTLEASDNVITFYYTPFTEARYTVRFVDTGGNTLAPDETHATSQASVTENYINIPGYYPNFYQQTLQLSPNAADNVITFVYTKNAPVEYTVRVFEENIGGGYTMTDEYTESAPVGSVVTVTPQPITGFTFQPQLSAISRVVASNGSTVLRMYYNRALFTVNFLAEGKGSLQGQTQFGNIQYQNTFGNAVSVPTVVPDPGYKLEKWTPGLPGAATEVTQNATYTATFVYDPDQWATITLLGNEADRGDTYTTDWLIGTNFTLPANPFERDDYTFLNWDAEPDGTGASYADEGTFLVTGNLTLYAQWIADEEFVVAYLNNGGTGAVSDPTVYDEGDEVTVLPNGFTYPGYEFVNWQEADGTFFEPGDTFDIEKNMVFSAQWRRDPGQWVTIIYDKNDPNANGAMGDEEVLAGEPHALAPNQFSLENYTFVGWNTTQTGIGGTGYTDGETITPGPGGGELVLYAQWQENDKFEIRYYANNETSDEVTDIEGYANVPHTIYPADTFEYEHHNFVRWTTNDDGTGISYLPGSTVLLTGDLTLYAYWLPRRLYEITYEDGFSTGSFERDGYAEDDGFLDITVADNPFFRLGYDFVDWISDHDVVAIPGGKIYDIKEDTVFTAQWAPTVYTIAYDLDGGAVNGVNPTHYTIETPTFELVNPTKPGYTFMGWTGTTLGDTMSEEVRIGQSQIGDLSFIAHWEYDPDQWTSITFVSEDENKGKLEGTLAFEGIIGEGINLSRIVSVAYPATMPAEGYVFGSWSEEIPAAFPEEDMVITAYFILAPTEPGSTPNPGSTPSPGSVPGSTPGSAPGSAPGDGSGSRPQLNGTVNPGGQSGGAGTGSSGGSASNGTGSNSRGAYNRNDVAFTGDTSLPWLLGGLAVLALAATGLLLIVKKRVR